MFLTRSPLFHIPKNVSSFDLHVLCTLPAFLLSQDQTLLDVFEKIRKTKASIHEYSVLPNWPCTSASFTKKKHLNQKKRIYIYKLYVIVTDVEVNNVYFHFFTLTSIINVYYLFFMDQNQEIEFKKKRETRP